MPQGTALVLLPPLFFPGPTPVAADLRTAAHALPPGRALVRALLDPAGHLVEGSLEILEVSDPRWVPILQAWWPTLRSPAATPPAPWTVVQQQIWMRRP